jgi:hypothetical protein
MTGEEYDKEMENKFRKSKDDLANMRKDEKLYGKDANKDEDEFMTPSQRKKARESKMRGRKDKYYNQVDDEDMSFA